MSFVNRLRLARPRRLNSLLKSKGSSKIGSSDRSISMPLDVLSLQSFYDSALGEVSRRLVGRVIRARWENCSSLSVAAVGYGTPFLDRFRDKASRCLALMPADQGVVIWPGGGRCAAALVDPQMLPLPTPQSTAYYSPTPLRRSIGRMHCSGSFGASPPQRGG